MVSISSIKTIQGAFFVGLLKEVTHLGSTHADEHFHEFRTGDGEERDIGLSGYSLGQQGFTGSGRAYQQGAAFGMEAPISVYFSGLCRKSTISVRISLASSSPATSAN